MQTPGMRMPELRMPGYECPKCECSECKCSECKCLKVNSPSWCGPVCKVIYLLAMGALWSAALYVFLEEATTNKAETPDKSRNLNQDCIWGWFFDNHDFWHILSSHALLMTVYLVMFMGHKWREKMRVKYLSENPHRRLSMGFVISNFGFFENVDDTARCSWTCSQNLRFLLSNQKQNEHQS